MSTAIATAAARPLRAPEREPRRHLEIAPSRAQRRARPRVVYALVTVAGIGLILLAQLLLSIVLADGAYRISTLQTEQRDLVREQNALAEDLRRFASTQNLSANAEALGMVASGNPVFLDLANGEVSGASTPAGGDVIGSHANLIANSLVDDSMVVDPNGQGTAGDSPVTTSTVPTSSTTPVPPGPIPSPTTH